MTTNLHVEISELQRQIEGYIGGQNAASLVFEFTDISGNQKLDVITVNPRHRQSFLFHSVEGIDQIDALKKMLDYVKTYKEKESSYTVQWTIVGDSELQTSYFRARNIIEALDKLYYGREVNSVTVFSVVLNPIA